LTCGIGSEHLVDGIVWRPPVVTLLAPVAHLTIFVDGVCCIYPTPRWYIWHGIVDRCWLLPLWRWRHCAIDVLTVGSFVLVGYWYVTVYLVVGGPGWWLDGGIVVVGGDTLLTHCDSSRWRCCWVFVMLGPVTVGHLLWRGDLLLGPTLLQSTILGVDGDIRYDLGDGYPGVEVAHYPLVIDVGGGDPLHVGDLLGVTYLDRREGGPVVSVISGRRYVDHW